MYKKYKLKNGKNVTRKDLISILDWCKKKLGRSKYFSIRNLEIRFKSNLDYYIAIFDVERNCIEINPTKIRNYMDLVATIIHEYVHFKQNPAKYEEIDMKLPRLRYYYDHPYEAEAEKIAQELKKECFHALKSELGWVKKPKKI